MRVPAHPTLSLALLAIEPGTDGARPGKTDPKSNPSPQRGAGAAYLMAGSILLGLGLGYLLDQHYGTSPRWTIALSMVFLVVGVYQTIREANK